MAITSEQLAALGIDAKWTDALNETFDKFSINTPKRQAAFIGQCAHESNNFKTLEENLHYKAESLMRVWPNRFPNLEIANQYANNPEKIANKVYANRMGNGDEASGEGSAFHGRGPIQLTGKENYANCGKAIGVDLISTPNLLLDPKYAALSAGWFWDKNHLNDLADKGDVEGQTKRINGGLLGLDDRKAKIAKAESVLS
jgi:putative chitinase